MQDSEELKTDFTLFGSKMAADAIGRDAAKRCIGGDEHEKRNPMRLSARHDSVGHILPKCWKYSSVENLAG